MSSMRMDPSGWQTRLDEVTIARYRDAGVWQDRTIADLVDKAALRQPDKIAVFDDRQNFTWARLRNEARALAQVLAARGLQRGAVVSFQLPNWYEVFIIDLACAYGGFVCNPIVPIYRDAEVVFIAKAARSRILFIPGVFRGFDYVAMANRLRHAWPDMLEVVVVRPDGKPALDFESFRATPCDACPIPPDPNDVKLIMYTSGTTGPAKGVLHTHNTLGAEIANFIDWLKLDGQDLVLMASPLTHITGYLYGLMLPLTLDVPVVLMDTWNAARAADLIDHHRVTFTIGATPFLQELARFAREHCRPLPSLRYFPTGGAPVSPTVIQEAERAFARCLSFRVYGSTEAPTITLGVPDPDQRFLSATTEGYVVGHDIRLVDDDGHSVSPGMEGEVISRGPEMCVGYAVWDETAEAFDNEGYFHTGDLAKETPEHCLVITGRKKDLIIRGGENISPKEVEDVLNSHPAIRDAAVVAMPHPRLGETGCAFVTLREGSHFDFSTMIRLFDRSGLAKQKYPERLEIVGDLPYTSAGKIRKNVLRSLAAAPCGKKG